MTPASPARVAATAFALAALAAAGAHLADPPRRPRAAQAYVIPPGTGAVARAGGSVADVLPQRVETAVGVRLTVENRDVETHAFGPFALAPGETWRRQFALPGAYAFTCSIYPVAGFTIDVAGPPRAGPAAALRRAALALWAGLAALLAGLLGVRLARGVGAGGPRAASLAAAWAGLGAGLVPIGLVALARTADWGPVLASGAAPAWLAAAAAAGAAAALVAVTARGGADAEAERGTGAPTARAADLDGAPGAGRARAALGLVALAVALAASPELGAARAARMALLLAGAGLLGAALAGQRRVPRDLVARPDGRLARRLALAGFALALAGLPLPPATPPRTALMALPALLAGAGVAALGALRTGDRGRLLVSAGGVAALAQLAVLWGALAAHADAVALPLYGNPVADDPASRARGAAIWAVSCAGCHAEPAALGPAVRAAGDRALLELLTRGRGAMPGLAYELDLGARGDVLNYLRAAVGESGTGASGG